MRLGRLLWILARGLIKRKGEAMDNKELMVKTILESFIGIKEGDSNLLKKRLRKLYLLGVSHGVDALNDTTEEDRYYEIL